MWIKRFAAAGLLASAASAVKIDIDDPKSIQNAALTTTFTLMSNYTSNHTGEIPGIVNDSWWESAVLYRTLIQYWSLTGDASNNPAVTQGMYWQRGDNDYMPSNISEYIGNDDQASWALAAMTAAESKFPEETKLASWITLAQNVFDIQAARWDTKNCGGGLRWQIWTFQAGYGIKNAISNGDLFELSARLARYTGNKTYVEWAEKVWDWTLSTQLMNNKTWTIADSMSVEDRCATLEHTQWSHNYAVYLSGAAYMYNLTNGDTKWKTGIDGLLNTTLNTFFPKKYGGEIMSEVTCEPTHSCNYTQHLFKGILASTLGAMTNIAPYTSADILPKLKGSAEAAAKSCSGGNDNNLCGERWYESEWDGIFGMEVQMSAASLFISNLFNSTAKAPVTSSTNGSSTNSTSGTSDSQPSATGGSNSGTSTDTPNGSSHVSALSGLAIMGVLAGVLAAI